MRVIVVGSGIAGLVVALRAAVEHDVTVITKGVLADGSTWHAQGGIAAAIGSDDSAGLHIADTLRAAGGLADPDLVSILCTEGPRRIRDLVGIGVRFDRDGAAFARGLEAAHSRARILHAGGDATGRAIQGVLIHSLRDAPVRVLERSMLTELRSRGGRVSGVEVLTDSGRARLNADAVVLATGGGGMLYPHTTNPAVSTGDGVAAALRAGVAVRDLEFYQFHPTALAVPGCPLVSEAVRGEGAVLVDSSGRRFMTGVHPDAELAPRDVLARAIHDRERETGSPVLLDATALGRAYLEKRFPTISAACRAHGWDIAAEPVPVTPAAHYWMGGIATDSHGRSSLPGLFAVGEVACTGVHGANRLASNSLLEALVFAWRCADALDAAWSHPASTAGRRSAAVARTAAAAPAFTRATLQSLMAEHAGLRRDGHGLEHAAGALDAWAAQLAATSASTTVDQEDRNLLTVARALVGAALAREESRGAHSRTDFPATADSMTREGALAC
ncbi:L-aspartate oxidase [Diaminobutyricimonas sp. TR449]|uniref:L-aspartate oxidase n=1 Tax=Diaminobutyricimonas sp. TR449 TaxID=2708076 RepID=UPI00142122D1|nr:L-aspartate oxidase [Diaminobutyricimonas sp. TR449]